MRPSPKTAARIADIVTFRPDDTPTLTDRRPAPRTPVHHTLRDMLDGIRATTAALLDGIERAAPRG